MPQGLGPTMQRYFADDDTNIFLLAQLKLVWDLSYLQMPAESWNGLDLELRACDIGGTGFLLAC